MKKIATIMVLLLMVSSALAAVDLPKDQLEGLAVPGIADSGLARSLVGNQNINVYIALPDGSVQEVGLVMDEGVITSVHDSLLDEPTLNVYADQATIQKLLSSKNPRKELKQALDEERLTYKVLGIGNKMKFGLAKAALSVAGIFSGDEDELTGAVIIETNHNTNQDSETQDQMMEETNDDYVQDEIVDDQDMMEDIDEEVVESKPKAETHTIMLTEKGFEPDILEIKAGDTVVWENIRERHPINAMIIGVRECRDVRSDIFGPGERFTWTFDEPMRCTIAGGVYTTKESRIIVE